MALRYVLMAATVVLFVVAGAIFVGRFWNIYQVMRKSRATIRTDQIGKRLISTIEQVFAHKRMLKVRYSGVLHLFIFSGFVVLLIDVVGSIGQVFSPGFSIGPVLGMIVDIWVGLVLIGVAMAVYQRAVIKPERYHGSDETDGYIILSIITCIVVGIVVHESFYPYAAGPIFGVKAVALSPMEFLAYGLSRIWVSLGWTGATAASIGYAVGYTMDILMIWVFLAYLPYSKHLHVFLAIPNIFVRKMGPHGELVTAPVPEEGIAIRSFRDLSWKDVLDLYTCTECGRCQAVCPAHAAGQPLSPKMVILELREALKKELSGEPPIPLAGGVVSQEELWACTTCGACMEACPVFIEHVPKIVGMRAALLEDGEIDKTAQKVLVGWDRQGNSFGQPLKKRPGWTKGLEISIKDARREPVDWLWFVGDFASYDPRIQDLTRLVARLLQQANVDFGILYDGESNSGNDALRIGEFGLFEALAQKNLEKLQEAEYNMIFTTDPHSLNALKNEYGKYGFHRPVKHYTEAFVDLIDQRKFDLKPLGIRATYHDPCYLGRWNRIFDAPRELMKRVGVDLVEMPRHGENSFCCGAGGGRIWMEEVGIKERPADQRIREALTLEGVTHFVVACPKDVAMFTAAVASTGNEGRLKVVDMAELLAEAAGLGVPDTLVAAR